MIRKSLVAVGIAALAGLSSSALADGIVHTGFTSQSVVGTGLSGGGFTFTLQSGFGPASGDKAEGGNGSVFTTFCLETGENLKLGVTYSGSIDTTVINGKSKWGTFHTVLEPQTAYLYSKFRAGTLSGYTGNVNSQRALQAAIWKFQDQINAAEWTAAVLANPLALTFYTAGTTSGWTNIGNVRVLNLYDSTSHQSEMALVPLPTGTAMAGLGVLGLVGGGAVRRRRV